MIKYFQKLKAKKGFTLVELIVVIAIIGVLAAILIPTMLGYVTQSKVTSANTTASSIKNEIDAFLTQCDTNGYGMKKSSDNGSLMKFVVTGGQWKLDVTQNTSHFNTHGKSWGASATVAATVTDASAISIRGGTDVTAMLALDLKELFPEVQTALIYALCNGGKCLGVLYTTETSSVTDVPMFSDLQDTSSKWPKEYGWDDATLGVHKGNIVGSAPVLQVYGTKYGWCS